MSGRTKPILDGQGTVAPLYVKGMTGTLVIENLHLTNGWPTDYPGWTPGQPKASAITQDSDYKGHLVILDSEFTNNKGAGVIEARMGHGPITIQRSRFTNNQASMGGTINASGLEGLRVEDTVISNNISPGITVSASRDVIIDRSTVSENGFSGVSLIDCLNCSVQNTTIYGNRLQGFGASTSQPTASPDEVAILVNSTVVANGGTSSTPNIGVSFRNPLHKLRIFNSVIATNGLGNTNCNIPAPNALYSYSIEATNSLFDDATCAPTGSGNLIGISPMLGVFGDNGGLTPTLLPLPGSPLIDAGDNFTCAARDQRAESRPVDKLGTGARCDIGAIEVQ